MLRINFDIKLHEMDIFYRHLCKLHVVKVEEIIRQK